ncbi:hypothetical protein [Aquabacter sp. CN5-332]
MADQSEGGARKLFSNADPAKVLNLLIDTTPDAILSGMSRAG